jgi:hypothetical protein
LVGGVALAPLCLGGDHPAADETPEWRLNQVLALATTTYRVLVSQCIELLGTSSRPTTSALRDSHQQEAPATWERSVLHVAVLGDHRDESCPVTGKLGSVSATPYQELNEALDAQLTRTAVLLRAAFHVHSPELRLGVRPERGR